MRWNGDRVLETYAVLESTLPEPVVTRIEDALLAGQLPRANRFLFLRVRVRVAPAPEIALGFAWEVPPTVADQAAVEELLSGVFLEGAPRRDARLDVFVTEDGPPADFVLTWSSGHPRVDQQLLWLVPQFEFRAARVEGIPFERAMPLTVTIRNDRE